MLDTVALDQRECLFKLHPASGHVCSTFSRPAAQASLLQGQQTYLPLRMFDYVALDQHTCLKPSSYVCNSFTRLAGMLQYHVLNVVLNQQACLLQLHPTTWHDSTSIHVCWSCIYHQICLNQLQLTYKHICSCVAETACIYVSLASDPQFCLYTSTQLTGW